MESLLNKIRGPEYNEHEKVMSRLEWLSHLSMIFNITAGVPLILPVSSSITTEAFLNTLIENFHNLPLMGLALYSKTSTVKALSFKDVFICFEHDFGKFINWDYIMEKILDFNKVKQGHSMRDGSDSPGSIDLNELVFISKLTSSSVDYDYETDHRSQRIGDLRIPQTPPGLENRSFPAPGEYTPSPRDSQDFNSFSSRALRVPELGDSFRTYVLSKENEDNIRLNLSYKKISTLSIKLPLTLIELDLCHNRLARMPNLEDLERLEYLNLSWNLLTSVTGLKKILNLKELYLSHNRIHDLENLSGCESLVIIDAGHNKISFFQNISALAELISLKLLNLDGNSIIKQIGFKENLANILPNIEEFDLKNIYKFTAFQNNLKNHSKGKQLTKSLSLKVKTKK
jgi:hypothetical protein